MQLITFLSATTAMVATASAKTAVELGKEYIPSLAAARVINRCDYPVHLWSVFKGTGCPSEGMVTLKQGETYSENYQPATDGKTGVSIKISKTKECKGNDIVQLEYFLEDNGEEKYQYNYLDVSYVDCLGGDCPTKSEGFYLKAGTQTGASTASAGNTWCPVLSCHDAVSCAKLAYILPDDVQTKTCDKTESMDFYMCGGDAPNGDYDSAPAPAPASSAEEAASSTVASSVVAPASSTVDDSYKIKAAAVTDAPEVKDVEKQSQKTKTQVEVVYVTAYEYVNAKRHAHGHARRHAPFHA